MLEELKILLGDSVGNYSEALLELVIKHSLAEVEEYCNREADKVLELCALRIAIIKLNRIGTEGLATQNYSGIGESYLNEYPADIISLLNRKRKVKVL
ncbi:MAG: hypothetical protein IKT32_00025 [Clostridia bacterium]|nr:hypothetical protein [Clostridia bacterium]